MYGSVGKTAIAKIDLSTNQAILGINIKIEQINMGTSEALRIQVVSKSEDHKDSKMSENTAELLRAMKDDDGAVTEADLDVAERVALSVGRAAGIPEEEKTEIAQELITAHLQHRNCKIQLGKKRMQDGINRYSVMEERIEHSFVQKKYILLDKNALPISQRYILEGEEWQKRKDYLKRLFPHYIFIVFSNELELPIDEMDKNNSIMFLSEGYSKQYETFNTRFVYMQTIGETELFPIDSLLCLGIGLLDISDTDSKGSPLASAVGRIYREITNGNIDLKEFLKTYKIELLIPPAQRYETKEIIELHSYAISIIEQAA